MSFLPLAEAPPGDEHGGMHPYVMEQLVQARRQEIGRLRRNDRRGCQAEGVGEWRRSAGRALLSLAVTIGVPRTQRDPARRSAAALLVCGPDV
jgi:hypothetical protein